MLPSSSSSSSRFPTDELCGFVCVRVCGPTSISVPSISVNTTCGIYSNCQRRPNAELLEFISCIYEGSPSVDRMRVDVKLSSK